nr:MAG TPA: hypothetical protein [Caudoviricetes sp.]
MNFALSLKYIYIIRLYYRNVKGFLQKSLKFF